MDSMDMVMVVVNTNHKMGQKEVVGSLKFFTLLILVIVHKIVHLQEEIMMIMKMMNRGFN